MSAPLTSLANYQIIVVDGNQSFHIPRLDQVFYEEEEASSVVSVTWCTLRKGLPVPMKPHLSLIGIHKEKSGT